MLTPEQKRELDEAMRQLPEHEPQAVGPGRSQSYKQLVLVVVCLLVLVVGTAFGEYAGVLALFSVLGGAVLGLWIGDDREPESR